MAVATSTTTHHAAKSIAALFAVRQGMQTTIEELERTGAVDDDEAAFNAACAKLERFDARILRVKPHTIAELLLQADIVRQAIDPKNDDVQIMFVRQLLANVAALA